MKLIFYIFTAHEYSQLLLYIKQLKQCWNWRHDQHLMQLEKSQYLILHFAIYIFRPSISTTVQALDRYIKRCLTEPALWYISAFAIDKLTWTPGHHSQCLIILKTIPSFPFKTSPRTIYVPVQFKDRSGMGQSGHGQCEYAQRCVPLPICHQLLFI